MTDNDTPHDEKLEDELNVLEGEIENEPTPRPAGAAGDLGTAAIVAELLTVGFPVFAPAWNVQANEIDLLAGAWAPVIDKYIPDLSRFIGVEVQALVVTFAVLGPRLTRPRTVDPAPDANETAGEPDETAEPAEPAPPPEPG